MAQKSMLYSSARVRVLEKKLINRDELFKLIDAPSAEEALNMLSERGYGSSRAESEEKDTLSAMLGAETADAAALLKELSADERVTDVFLYRADVTNLKLLIKRNLLGSDQAELDDSGLIPHTVIRSMVKNETYFDLPEEILSALHDIHARIRENPPKPVQKTESEPSLSFDPAFISLELDRAYYRYARSVGNAFLNEYFSAECDFANLSAFIRIKRRGGTESDLLRVLMPTGKITEDALKSAFSAEDSAKLPSILTRGLDGEFMRTVLNLFPANGEVQPEAVEMARDNYLMELIKRGSGDMDSILPVIGFYMAKRREAESVRLIITLKRNGFEPEFIKQRLRKTFV